MMDSGLRLQVDSSDPEDASIRLGRLYCPHRVMPAEGNKKFHARQFGGGAEGLGVYRLSFGPGTTYVEPTPFDNFVLISRPVQGRFGIKAGDQDRLLSTNEPIALDPYTSYHMRLQEDCTLLTLRFDRDQFENAVAELRGTSNPAPVRFPIEMRPSRPAFAAWDSVTRFLMCEALPTDLLTTAPLLRGQVIRMLIASVLEAYPGVTAAAGLPSCGTVGPAAVRRATAYIEAAAGEDIRMSDIAAAARLSPRALQEAFRKHLDTTPMAYLKFVRLHSAHTELRQASPHHGATVASIAYRWGFGNLGRFAAEFRREFGRLPSEVLGA